MDLMPKLEQELQAPVVQYFLDQGAVVAVEVPFNGRIADVVAVAPDGAVTAVELKLNDWPVALRQATAYQVGADRTFVALPLATIARYQSRAKFRAAFDASACGLLAVNHPWGDVRELMAAAPSPRRLDFLQQHLASLARGSGVTGSL